MTESQGASGDPAATPDEVAETVAKAMYGADRFPRSHGIGVVECGPGFAVTRMAVRDDMVNSHGLCHGGATYALADTAFAYACNSYNQNMVAQVCTMSYLRAAYAGEILTATARETLREGRTGIYDVTVTNGAGQVVASFRGQCRRIEGQYIPGLTAERG